VTVQDTISPVFDSCPDTWTFSFEPHETTIQLPGLVAIDTCGEVSIEYTAENPFAVVDESHVLSGLKEIGGDRLMLTAHFVRGVHKHDSLSHEKQQKQTHTTMASRHNNNQTITNRGSQQASNTPLEPSLSLYFTIDIKLLQRKLVSTMF
jgi:hypothetical protein